MTTRNTENSGVQVEVCVQDCFTEASGMKPAVDAQTWQKWFECWLESLSSQLPSADSYELSLRLTDDAEIQVLNSQYRQQNKPTDVLAFAALETDVPQLEELRSLLPLYLGDIAISIDTASKQAQQQAHSLSTELAWLAAHGLLHLLGWDHPDEESLSEMLEQQTLLLRIVGLDVNLD
ncbi:MAG: Endoribonuclease YbeY [Chroococcidiopsis cubana SAG 39.79]|uniref:Endoribonuclease YbeY n=1 Tax=Chroococcidiopsis cubana SAG 39.79 TaxID=388085 RepID=A0AB37UL65_9CYAN|nr:rRNA maturation RNase YbeY [Chroococcidiopsis cubana]MDZ4872658.1 Endoribonuclease YbeY [Chroococcidiopsis cubana SAG 39.79]PSB60863.1 rRNA maturation RNase YbeY [Chroococcidiopsis cubana CCALA 043]RUT12127.1 endoribonuclease YbeY [Chroococcidiopsis cubana SAG 39.79]